MKPLVVIPARGGSKGVPDKNIKLLAGKPLIQYTIEAARELFDNDTICVSTDSNEIKKSVEQMGLKVPFLRPKELATDTASSQEVLLHALNWFTEKYYLPDMIVLLQPTSPFRTTQHLREALELFDKNIDMVVSVKETKANPYYVLFEEDENGYLIKSKEGDFTRRQDCPKVWEFNGAIYVINTRSLVQLRIGEFKKIMKYEMDTTSSHDIDSLYDWKIAEVLLNEEEKNTGTV